jgi:hypothetical protein
VNLPIGFFKLISYVILGSPRLKDEGVAGVDAHIVKVDLRYPHLEPNVNGLKQRESDELNPRKMNRMP